MAIINRLPMLSEKKEQTISLRSINSYYSDTSLPYLHSYATTGDNHYSNIFYIWKDITTLDINSLINKQTDNPSPTLVANATNITSYLTLSGTTITRTSSSRTGYAKIEVYIQGNASFEQSNTVTLQIIFVAGKSSLSSYTIPSSGTINTYTVLDGDITMNKQLMRLTSGSYTTKTNSRLHPSISVYKGGTYGDYTLLVKDTKEFVTYVNKSGYTPIVASTSSSLYVGSITACLVPTSSL